MAGGIHTGPAHVQQPAGATGPSQNPEGLVGDGHAVAAFIWKADEAAWLSTAVGVRGGPALRGEAHAVRDPGQRAVALASGHSQAGSGLPPVD